MIWEIVATGWPSEHAYVIWQSDGPDAEAMVDKTRAAIIRTLELVGYVALPGGWYVRQDIHAQRIHIQCQGRMA